MHDFDAIAGGYHPDPFSVLGPHSVKPDGAPGSWEIRAWLPDAETAELIVDGMIAMPMTRATVEGLWIAHLDQAPGHYRFHLRSGPHEWEEEDPYRFPPVLTGYQLHLHAEGTHYETYNTLGAHVVECEGVPGVHFAVWAPNALVVSVIGDFNAWDLTRHPMRARDGGIWELFLPNVGLGAIYKYHIRSRVDGYVVKKADPFAFACELPPSTASIVTRIEGYEWGDAEWLERRAKTDALHSPMSVYEVHLGSWLRGEGNRMLTYRELAEKLVGYVKEMGFTHIELMPVLEHPFGGSWGYQVTGYYAPTSRHGSPHDFMYFVDRCHQAGIGVILDWVPAHFPRDEHGLGFFDGTHLYEHDDPRKGEHRDWGTKIFNFGRNEVRSFLISNALWWLKTYHIDGLRVDAVASMLYLNYSREEGDWIPNAYGGNENLEAIEFVKRFNEQVHRVPGAISIAEESTSFAGVSRPVYANGLGFTFKWNMGWMHDMLGYFKQNPLFRKYSHQHITFGLLYAFTENFVLPISHDEVVHGKASLLSKMPGDEWQRFANARAFLAFMYGHPGKKLLFMGAELGQYDEWNENVSLRWDLLQYGYHRKLQRMLQSLNQMYRDHPALWEVDNHWAGFEWVDLHDIESSVISFLRFSRDRKQFLLFCCNFTPVVRGNYRVGAPAAGRYREVFNTDAETFGGSNVGNMGRALGEWIPQHRRPASISVTLPPLAVVVFEPEWLEEHPPPPPLAAVPDPRDGDDDGSQV